MQNLMNRFKMNTNIPQTTILVQDEYDNLQNGLVGSIYYANGQAVMTASAFNYGQEHGEI